MTAAQTELPGAPLSVGGDGNGKDQRSFGAWGPECVSLWALQELSQATCGLWPMLLK